ncbi:MAG TPA: biotin--[acetyl-CoA-carboxylase] ligase [Actinomycetota bacterium]|nr:biotin--[acetyl-CoA-carboxylase] ligase [Actinomycetota bacterium]
MGSVSYGHAPGSRPAPVTSAWEDTIQLEGRTTGRFGHPFRHVRETGSTNADALRWAEEGAPEGAVIVADHQTAGRGRWGREWWSEPASSLLFSLVLRPDPDEARVALLTTAAGVAAAEALSEVGAIEAKVKWPNDVVVEGKKLAGILVESRSRAGRVEVAVVGIGVNLLQTEESFPPQLRGVATSLAGAGASPVPSREDVLVALLARLEETFDHLGRPGGPDAVIGSATAISAMLGRPVVVRGSTGEVFEGMAVRLLHDGALEVDTDGVLRRVASGEIATIRYR